MNSKDKIKSLETLKNFLISDKDTLSGICHAIAWMPNELISQSQRKFLTYLIGEEKIKHCREGKTFYRKHWLWPVYEKAPRLAWINEQIKIIENEQENISS